MLCRACRRAIALPKPAPSTLVAKASLSSLPIATRSYTSQSLPASRAAQTSIFAFRSSSYLNTKTIPRRCYSSATETQTPLEKPDHLDDAESTIWDKLATEFAPSELVVQDVSGGCGSMYAIDITSAKFKGANMLKQQRMVNAVLGDMLKQWHGVQLRTKAPQ
ncbi:BolA-like protein [Colletotrichum orchidophilum]|uniref:BolA-like protein n=1 Tax=Colletotrichum orchidophilum TaxID=1209926 RepID=A0A1G4BAH4_9PEZI|nr:BolA-like protein [Colletotrichum orchidophilum]OHE98403.1 BolA-like protein [Colletotrichum orchidophilum]